jgi:hypothetical protein
VPHRRRTWYSSLVRWARHSSSVFCGRHRQAVRRDGGRGPGMHSARVNFYQARVDVAQLQCTRHYTAPGAWDTFPETNKDDWQRPPRSGEGGPQVESHLVGVLGKIHRVHPAHSHARRTRLAGAASSLGSHQPGKHEEISRFTQPLTVARAPSPPLVRTCCRQDPSERATGTLGSSPGLW